MEQKEQYKITLNIEQIAFEAHLEDSPHQLLSAPERCQKLENLLEEPKKSLAQLLSSTVRAALQTVPSENSSGKMVLRYMLSVEIPLEHFLNIPKKKDA